MTQLERDIVEIKESLAHIRAVMDGEDGCLQRCREMRGQVGNIALKMSALTVSVAILTSIIINLLRK